MLLTGLFGLLKRAMKNFRSLGFCFILALFIAFPVLAGDPTITSIGVYTLLFTGAAVAWNIFSGYTGYISLGHATFYGLGGYALAIMCQDWHIKGGYAPFLLLPLTGLVIGAFAIPLGWIALHTRRHTFMVITIAIFFIFHQLAYNLLDITGGSSGIYLPFPQWGAGVYDLPFYYVSLALLLLVTCASLWIRTSKFGLGLLAIRDDEDRALGLGVKTGHFKLGAYAISAFFTGMVGAMVAYYAGFVSPLSAFSITFDITIALTTFLGGAGTVVGPIVGGLLLQPLQAYLTIQYASIATDLDLVLFGGLLLVIILVLPGGIVPALRRRWPVWRASLSKASLVAMLLLTSTDMSIAAPQQPDAQETPGDTSKVLQRNQVALSIPHRPSELAASTLVTQRLRAQRLLPFAQSAPASTPGTVAASPSDWLCPRCNVPLWLRGETHFCTQCGLTLSLPKRDRPSRKLTVQ
jgi:ABC-type branched-subunit amino acid transport system permease subunit